MSFNLTYKPFGSVNLYHHYFLDDGEKAFDGLKDEFDNPIPLPQVLKLKNEQLEKYNFSSFATIIPTEQTKKFLSNQKIIFKQHKTGITLLIQAEETGVPGTFKPYIELTQNECLQFLIYITDPIFENYSTVSPIPAIPFYFSNAQPITELNDWYAINVESEVPHTIIENFNITSETNKLLSTSINFKERNRLFGVISLNVSANDTTKSLIELSGNLPNSPPVFKIQLANRKTYWQYINAKDGSVIHKSPSLLPLVKNGIVPYTFTTSEKRPAAKPNRLIFIKDGSGAIIETISEILI